MPRCSGYESQSLRFRPLPAAVAIDEIELCVCGGRRTARLKRDVDVSKERKDSCGRPERAASRPHCSQQLLAQSVQPQRVQPSGLTSHWTSVHHANRRCHGPWRRGQRSTAACERRRPAGAESGGAGARRPISGTEQPGRGTPAVAGRRARPAATSSRGGGRRR